MADEVLPNAVGLGNYPHRIVDMGDGTWAEKVFAVVAVGGTQVSSLNPLPVVVASGATSLADQSVVDSAGIYWLVRDNGSTLTYVNWSTGTAGTPSAPVSPAGKLTGEQLISTQYTVMIAGSGYAVGDVLAHIVILNIATSPASVLASVWANISQSTILSANPLSANLTQSSAAVAISSMPPLPAGSNAIGSVAVSALPAIPAGANAIGSVAVSSLPALPPGSNTIGTVSIGGSLPAFSATPAVNVATLPALPPGGNLIGAVNLDIAGAALSASNAMPVLDAYLAPSSSSWTTATAVNTALTFSTNGYDTAIVTLVASASFAGGAVVFEVFDGANWMPVKAANILNYTTTAATIAPAANTANGYQISMAGFPQFRVRLSSALAAGSLGVTAIISSAPDVSLVTVGLDPTQPLPAGTNTLGAVTQANPVTISAGQQTLTAGAAALPSQALTNGVVLTALTTNMGTVYVGPAGVTASTGYPLNAGQSVSYAVTNQGAIFIIGTNTTDKVAFTGN